MKKGIFEGKAAARLLYTLSHNLQRFFSAREIAEINHVGVLGAKKLLQEFLKSGLVKAEEKRGERYYGLDPRSPLVESLNGILGKRKMAQNDVVGKIVRGLGDMKFVALTGVFVGLVRSEIDLLLAGAPSARRVERVITELSRLASNEINYALMSEKEFRDRHYSYDWFLKEVLDRGPVVLVDKLTNKRHPRKSARAAAVFSNFKR